MSKKKQLRGGGNSLDSQASLHTTQSTKTNLKPYSNFHFKDVFGDYHRFFRPYTYTAKELIVRVLPKAYARMDIDLVWTKSKKALVSYTNFRTHLLSVPTQASIKQSLIAILRLSKNWLKYFCKPKIIQTKGNVALLTRDVQGCYGHFIREMMIGLRQIQLSNLQVDYYVLPQDCSFQKELVSLLKISESQIIPARKNTLIQADNLIIPTLLGEYETIEYREHVFFRLITHSTLASTMYDFILKQPIACQNPFRKVFFERPKTSNRNIENAKEVENVFKEFGFEIVLPDSLSVKQQIQLMSETKILAGLHGSSLDNALFANANIAVFELFSQYYHDSGPQYTALLKHCKYFYMVGETKDTSMHPQQENAYFNPNKLREALKIISQYVEL